MKSDTIPIVIIIFLIAFLFLGFGMSPLFGGVPWMSQMHYGSQSLCSNVGGIWCYWPAYALSNLISILVVIILILLLILLIKKLQGGKK